ncbi:MAG: Smr/MutS family protein [Xanthobacteraceae bacterium]
MSGRGGKNRSLSEEERTLWRDVTRGIVPLQPAGPKAGAQRARDAHAPSSSAKTAKSADLAPPQRAKPELLPALAPLGRRAKQRVARGRDAIDGRLDLHGLTQAQAHGALLRFLQAAQARDARLVMVITGKGSRGGAEGGVLKRQVPMWLKLTEFRPYVVGFEDAHRAHGGEGALYVRVRRGRGAA